MLDYLSDTTAELVKNGTDHLGSTRGLADTTGAITRTYTYDPDGNHATSGTGAQTSILYASGHLTAQADGPIYHFGARYYAPNIARWTQQDPLEQYADLRQANRYVYAAADPANAIDPTGASINPIAWVEDLPWVRLVAKDGYAEKQARIGTRSCIEDLLLGGVSGEPRLASAVQGADRVATCHVG